MRSYIPFGEYSQMPGGRRSEERLQDHSAVGDESHEEAERGAHDDGRDLAVLNVHEDEHEALDRQNRGGNHCKHWLPVENAWDDQSHHADEFENAEGRPGISR